MNRSVLPSLVLVVSFLAPGCAVNAAEADTAPLEGTESQAAALVTTDPAPKADGPQDLTCSRANAEMRACDELQRAGETACTQRAAEAANAQSRACLENAYQAFLRCVATYPKQTSACQTTYNDESKACSSVDRLVAAFDAEAYQCAYEHCLVCLSAAHLYQLCRGTRTTTRFANMSYNDYYQVTHVAHCGTVTGP